MSPERTRERVDLEGDAAPAEPSLHTQLHTMKQEIDALQIAMAEPARPWYRQAPVLIAMGALVFSVLTTYYADRRANLQDAHNADVELRQLVREIAEVTTENNELVNRFGRNPQALLLASSLGRTNVLVLANEAAELVDEYPEQVSAAEYYAVGAALSTFSTSDRVFDYYERALTKAQETQDNQTYLAVTRSLAIAHFGQGNVEQGRDVYERALIQEADGPLNPNDRLQNPYTHLQWALSELSVGNCEAAIDQYTEAQAQYQPLEEEGFDLSTINPQMAALQTALDERC